MTFHIPLGLSLFVVPTSCGLGRLRNVVELLVGAEILQLVDQRNLDLVLRPLGVLDVYGPDLFRVLICVNLRLV